MPGKRVVFDDQTWQAIALLASDRKVNFQALAEEAFGDLLRKHNQPTSLKAAFRQSIGAGGNVHPFPGRKQRKRKSDRK